MKRRGTQSVPGRGPPKKQNEYSKNIETNRIVESLPFTTNGFKFSEVIGSGSYAVIFKVHHSGYQRDFAAKMIPLTFGWSDENGEEVFQSEINALKRLNHKNIIKIYDSFRYMNQLVMIFQYCQHGTLKQLIQAGKGILPRLHIPYMKQILSALSYSHERNIAHRDIKPPNIFIDDFHRPLLADFGLSSLITRDDDQCSDFVGSFLYRAPEMIEKKPYDPFKADVWALGVVFYLMVTGNDPWPTYNMGLMKDSICQGKYEIPETVNPRIAEVIKKMLVVDPDKRSSIREIEEMEIFNLEPNSSVEGQLNPFANRNSIPFPMTRTQLLLNSKQILTKKKDMIVRSQAIFHTTANRPKKYDFHEKASDL